MQLLELGPEDESDAGPLQGSAPRSKLLERGEFVGGQAEARLAGDRARGLGDAVEPKAGVDRLGVRICGPSRRDQRLAELIDRVGRCGLGVAAAGFDLDDGAVDAVLVVSRASTSRSARLPGNHCL